MKILKNKKIWSAIFIFYLLLILILNIIPNFTPESLQIQNESLLRTDYIQHILSFLILPVFYFLSGEKTFINRFLKSPWSLIFAGILYASFTEILQLFVPGRTFNPVDLFLNVTGLLSGIGIVWLGRRSFGSITS